ncbi:hypothetical protein KR215_010937 [Drosophila sulfurigaster]|nr:hypothetical protein KR215_010937 [Drosophila sulfurigaster]
MNSKENGPGANCNQSFDDDNCSNYSGNSHVSARPGPDMHSSIEGEEEDEQPIRVRDMINLYNYATQKNQELAQAKSIYFGSNMKGIDMEAAQQQQQLQQEQECCNGIYLNVPVNDSQQPGGSHVYKSKPGNFHLTTSDDQTSMQQSLQGDGAGGESIEKSYQSKTTIRRTEQGVRIIIDIFFDKQEHDIDIIGSRVETDIPESRILAEFQQHSLAMRSQQLKSNQSPNV